MYDLVTLYVLSDVGFEVGDRVGVTPGIGGGQVESHVESADQQKR